MMSPGWYLRRLRRMGPREVLARARHTARKVAWRRRRVAVGAPAPTRPTRRRPTFAATRPEVDLAIMGGPERDRLVAAADEIMAGRLRVFGHERDDLVDPDWFIDPESGRRAPDDVYAFSVPYRDQERVGNIKNIWELSRHHHLTVLAAAYRVTGDDRYAERVDTHLRSWWAQNPFLSGVHWTSGIELGIRLISWVWVRRLLDGWSGATALFEDNPVAVAQVHDHQVFLDAFRSSGSSANNHVIAEAAGLLVAAVAFDWFEQSPRWARTGADLLTAEVAAQTFPSGLNREMASEYHGLSLELALVGAAELALAGQEVPVSLLDDIVRATDALAGTVDTTLAPARYGDGDDGLVLVLDDPQADRWASILTTGRAVFGALDWWPALPADDLRTVLFGAILGRRPGPDRPATRPDHYPDAGVCLLRTEPGDGPELWVRCDGGPMGFLSIAAHGHADALSVEVRHDGVEVLADPGTYCYHGDPEWRSYFRGTRGHSTVEVAGDDQGVSGGPFLWSAQADGVGVVADASAEPATWRGEHHGYARLDPPVVHRRRVGLDRRAATVTIDDELVGGGGHDVVLRWHLGPDIDVALDGSTAALRWSMADGSVAAATLVLPESLAWTVHCGETDPVRGWYSPGFGTKVPASVLEGRGDDRRQPFATRLVFAAD